jgi:hypothetical protein
LSTITRPQVRVAVAPPACLLAARIDSLIRS